MSLPELPILPSGAEYPVTSTEDALAAYPERVRDVETAPVRDAIIEGQTALFFAWQNASDYAAAQSDPTRATGIYLEEFTDDVGIHRQVKEEDENLRDRLFAPPAVVTPSAIKTAIDGILALRTPKRCYLYESIADRVYVNNRADATWKLYVGNRGSTMNPDYPDRRYALRPRSEPGGPIAFNRTARGRFFIVRIPNLDVFDEQAAYVEDRTSLSRDRFYVFNRGSASTAYLFASSAAASAAYATIINTVGQLRGHGIRWRLFVDTKL